LAIVPSLLPPSIPFLTMPRLDLGVALFGIALAVAASVILTGWPIVRLLMSAPSPRGMAARPRPVVYRVLVISQLAITVALISTAGLLGQSLQTIEQRDPGFALDRVFVATIGLPSSPSTTPEQIALMEQRLL